MKSAIQQKVITEPLRMGMSLRESDPMTRVQTILQRELVRRCESNPQFSMRAFAKVLKMSPAHLSLVLSGQRRLSITKKHEIINSLGFGPRERQAFLAQSKTVQVSGLSSKNQTDLALSLDQFDTISMWYHLPLLSLLKWPDQSQAPRALSKKLGISVYQVNDALARLLRLKLIKRNSEERWTVLSSELQFDNTISSVGARDFHKQMIGKALLAIDNEPFEERIISSILIDTDKAQLPALRNEVRDFKRYLNKKYSNQNSVRDIYCLSIQIFSVTKSDVKDDGPDTRPKGRIQR